MTIAPREVTQTSPDKELHPVNKCSNGNKLLNRQAIVPLAGAGLFAVLLSLWICFDHHIPNMDEAGTLLNGKSFCELFKHPRLWKPDWWHQCLTVNFFYPPFVYALSGLLRLVFGWGRAVDAISLLVFNIILSLSVYGLTRILTGSMAAAFAALLLINLYPSLNSLNHVHLLDYPLVSMVALALLSLVWWNKSATWSRSLLCGLALGFACLTKQIGGAFLALPVLSYLTWHIYRGMKSDTTNTCLQKTHKPSSLTRHPSFRLLVACGIASALFLPWLITNLRSIQQFAQYNLAHMPEQSFLQNAVHYLSAIPHIMSPLLLALFGLSLITPVTIHRQLMPISLSAVGGFILICLIGCTAPLDRYLTPALICTAVFTGAFLGKLLCSQYLGRRLTAFTFLIIAFMQFVSFNYSPYPINNRILSDISTSLGINLRSYESNRFQRAIPRPPGDWGHEWAIKQVEAIDKDNPVWLNILSDSAEINARTFELVARYLGSAVRPTTSRVWTIKGDQASFSEKTARYYQWYLLKEGDNGNIFENVNSANSDAQLKQFITQSGHYKFVASKLLPDGSHMKLYRMQ